MQVFVFYLIMGLLMVSGLVLTSKEAGWPSEAERRNKFRRSVRSAVGATMFGVGLLVVILFRASPDNFFDNWSLPSALGFLVFLVIPAFAFLVIGSYVQYSILEKSQSFKARRIREIIGTKIKPKDQS